jgi:excisionase family DNA binding protein
MLTREQKETMLNQILELMTAIAYDEPVENAPVPEKKPEKVKMLTVRECTELIDGLSKHTVRQLVKQGKVKSVRTGEGRNGKILVNKADLIAYFNGKEV